MKHLFKYGLLLSVALSVISCSTQKYIYDISSSDRQKELKNARAGHVFDDIILIGSVSIASFAFLGTEVEWQPTDKQFKKLKLLNPSSDTIYVNMLTDIYWDKNDYCDFMDIRIPPRENCKILIPVNSEYHLYFSNTPENDDDEMLKINTGNITQIILKPGMTLTSGSD